MSGRQATLSTRGFFSLRRATRWIPHAAQRAARDPLVRYRERGLTNDDLLLVSFPRSGSTWLRFLLATALTSRDLGYDDVAGLIPDMGGQSDAPPFLPGGGRLIKSHESHRRRSSSPSSPRVLYLVRDGRDVAVSLFHFFKRMGVDVGDFDQFVPLHAAGRIGVYGSWQDHVLGWMSSAADAPDRMAVIRYEDLLADTHATLDRVDRLFGLGVGERRLAAAIASSTPSRMRSKEARSAQLMATQRGDVPFVREAKAGGWREAFDPTMLLKLEANIGAALLAAGYALSSSDPRQASVEAQALAADGRRRGRSPAAPSDEA